MRLIPAAIAVSVLATGLGVAVPATVAHADQEPKILPAEPFCRAVPQLPAEPRAPQAPKVPKPKAAPTPSAPAIPDAEVPPVPKPATDPADIWQAPELSAGRCATT